MSEDKAFPSDCPAPSFDDVAPYLDDYFRSDGWLEKAQSIINEGRAERLLSDLKLSDAQERTLSLIVGEYLMERYDWGGYLNRGQAASLTETQKKAAALEAAIAKATAAEADWYLHSTLEDLELSEEEPLKRLTALLAALKEMEVRSPQIGPDARSGTVWKSPSELEIRGRLQVKLDRWWTKVTSLPKDVSDDQESPYWLFLADLFGRMIIADPPGASASVVKAARKRLREHESESAVKKHGELLRQGKLDHLGGSE